MTTTQRGLAAACCVASAALAALLPGALHHRSPAQAAAQAASFPVHTAGTKPSASPSVVGVASVTNPSRSASVTGVPAGQSVTTAPDSLPAAVTGLTLVSNTWTSGTLIWGGSSPFYRVQVDGRTVRPDSASTSIILSWPSDGHRLVVRVAGVDVHGTHGSWTSLAVQPLVAGSNPSSQPSQSPASTAPSAPASAPATEPSAPASASKEPTTQPSASAPATSKQNGADRGASGEGDTSQDAGGRNAGTGSSAPAALVNTGVDTSRATATSNPRA